MGGLTLDEGTEPARVSLEPPTEAEVVDDTLGADVGVILAGGSGTANLNSSGALGLSFTEAPPPAALLEEDEFGNDTIL